MNFIEKLAKEAEGLVESLKNKRFKGLKDILTDIYHDDAHFIYELLQNAEDAQATKVIFTLDSQSLRFRHNGKQQFTPEDIEAINSINYSAKRDDVNKIGQFGMGFKAVFSYTQTPQIYSGKYAFEIHDLVSPKEIKQIPEITKGRDKATYFQFPFKHPQKTEEAAFEEIRKTIENLPPNTILFLQNIKEIRWEIEKDGKQIGFISLSKMQKPNCYEIRKKTDKLQKTYWLRFTKNIPPKISQNITQKKNRSVAIAFRLIPEKAKRDSKKVDYKIDGEVQKGDVAIFFPAEKETSNLRFYLHAPFAATVARDSIKNQSENLELRDLLVELLIESLANIKKSGLLDHNFLAILPNNKDELPEFYESFRDKIIEAFQNESYTPTWDKSYLPAKNLLQSVNEIKQVINKKTVLNRLVEREDVDWVVDSEKGRVYDFLASLKIKEWNWRELLETVGKLFSDKDTADEILSEFPDEWLKSFYVLLGKSKEESNYYWRRIKDANIVRLQDENHIAGKGAFFQTESLKNAKGVSIVKPETYQSNKNASQNEKAEKFLRDLGVTEFKEKDEIKIILERHYNDELKFTEVEHIKHLKKFIAFLKKNSGEKSVFSEYTILKVKNGKYKKPTKTFLDKPYEKTNLTHIESFLNEDFKWKLWSGYSNKIKNQKEFIRFLKDIGVNYKLEIPLIKISKNHPNYSSLKQDLTSGARESSSSVDEDYQIKNLDNMLQQKNRGISQLVWKTISEANKTILQARYRPNQQDKYKERIAPSQLVHTLKQHAWIPDKKGNFYEPQEVTLEMLPDDFPIIKGNGWLSAIGLGTQTEKSKLDEEQKLERLAKQLNLTVPELEKAREWAKMSDEEKAKFEEFKLQKAIEEEEEEEEDGIRQKDISELQKTQLVKARYGQGIFRASVEKIENRCRLTDVNDKRFLIASHIKPWRKSTDDEKLDGNNGLLLSPHVDKLFDKGWISFTDEGKILCADDEVKEIMEIWGLDINKSVGSFSEQQQKYLAYHRENIFKSK